MLENQTEKNIENDAKNTIQCVGYHKPFGFTYRFGGLRRSHEFEALGV